MKYITNPFDNSDSFFPQCMTFTVTIINWFFWKKKLCVCVSLIVYLIYFLCMYLAKSCFIYQSSFFFLKLGVLSHLPFVISFSAVVYAANKMKTLYRFAVLPLKLWIFWYNLVQNEKTNHHSAILPLNDPAGLLQKKLLLVDQYVKKTQSSFVDRGVNQPCHYFPRVARKLLAITRSPSNALLRSISSQ